MPSSSSKSSNKLETIKKTLLIAINTKDFTNAKKTIDTLNTKELREIVQNLDLELAAKLFYYIIKYKTMTRGVVPDALFNAILKLSNGKKIIQHAYIYAAEDLADTNQRALKIFAEHSLIAQEMQNSKSEIATKAINNAIAHNNTRTLNYLVPIDQRYILSNTSFVLYYHGLIQRRGEFYKAKLEGQFDIESCEIDLCNKIILSILKQISTSSNHEHNTDLYKILRHFLEIPSIRKQVTENHRQLLIIANEITEYPQIAKYIISIVDSVRTDDMLRKKLSSEDYKNLTSILYMFADNINPKPRVMIVSNKDIIEIPHKLFTDLIKYIKDSNESVVDIKAFPGFRTNNNLFTDPYLDYEGNTHQGKPKHIKCNEDVHLKKLFTVLFPELSLAASVTPVLELRSNGKSTIKYPDGPSTTTSKPVDHINTVDAYTANFVLRSIIFILSALYAISYFLTSNLTNISEGYSDNQNVLDAPVDDVRITDSDVLPHETHNKPAGMLNAFSMHPMANITASNVTERTYTQSVSLRI